MESYLRSLNPMLRFMVVLPLAAVALVANDPATEARFAKAAAEFLRWNQETRPLSAVGLGLHEFDGRYVVPTAATNAAVRIALMDFRNRFAAVDRNQLSLASRRDLSVIQIQVGTGLLFMDRLRWMQRSPLAYSDQPDVSIYLKRDWKSLDERVRDITAILRLAPAHFAAARTNLDRRLPRPWIELGILVAEGTANFWEKDVATAVAQASDPTVRGEFAVANTAALQAIRGYIGWLKAERLPHATDEFALGREGFVELLGLELIRLTPEQVLETARKELKAEQARFAEAARILDATKPAPEVFLAIQNDHPTEDGLIPETRRNLEAIRDFVISQKLVTIPSEVRAQVKATLPPFRATSFASMDTPGPFETRATEAYYYVTPTEPEWTAEQKREWLTAFNYYTTDVVSIHEAYPGHYVQFLALNASSTTPVAKVFGSYAFIEGWAHYTEQMVIDAGYAGPGPVSKPTTTEDRIRMAKYRLGQSNEALLRLARLSCALQLHCQGMTVDQATQFFMKEAYYQEKPARAEAQRGTFDPGYGFYTLGKLQLLKLRADWQAQEGEHFTLQRFHDAVLSHGMPPIRLLRELMLKNPASWDDIL